jgi:hypothetical protein
MLVCREWRIFGCKCSKYGVILNNNVLFKRKLKNYKIKIILCKHYKNPKYFGQDGLTNTNFRKFPYLLANQVPKSILYSIAEISTYNVGLNMIISSINEILHTVYKQNG